VQLSCTSDPSHPGSAWSKHGTKASLQSRIIETGLLQLASVWCPNRGGVEAAAPAEQRCPYCSRFRSTMWYRTAAATTSLAARRKSIAFRNRTSRCDQLRRHRLRRHCAIVPVNDRQDILIVPRPLRNLLFREFKLNLLGVLFMSLHLRFGMICQLMYNLVSQFMFLNRDTKLFFLTVHLTELTDVVWSSERLCICIYRFINVLLLLLLNEGINWFI